MDEIHIKNPQSILLDLRLVNFYLAINERLRGKDNGVEKEIKKN